MIVRARAPLRLGLAGGGTDVSPYSETYGGAVMNATINKYTWATIEECGDGKLAFAAADHGRSAEYDLASEIDPSGIFALHAGVYNRVVRDYCSGRPLPIRMTTYSDVPPGSGLGSSSTLVVAMLQAYVEYLGLPLGEYEIAHLAYVIERSDLGFNGGKQDQYAATFGGFNYMEFYAGDRVIVNPLRIKDWVVSELEASLVLHYSGLSRESALIIDQQARNVENRQEQAIEAMHQLKQESVNMKESLLKGDLDLFARTMDMGWRSKKQIASGITNPLIEQIEQIARQSGAAACKISGAGGGGPDDV